MTKQETLKKLQIRIIEFLSNIKPMKGATAYEWQFGLVCIRLNYFTYWNCCYVIKISVLKENHEELVGEIMKKEYEFRIM